MSASSQYRALDPEKPEIRILHIAPGLDDISCTLHHVSLDDSPVYGALSYAWGDPAEQHIIQLHGQPCSIRIALYEALLSLRDEKEEVHVWIDALCINQNDNAEKTAQVQLMRNIYEKAYVVLVWLGPAISPATDSTMKGMRIVGAALMSTGLWDTQIGDILELETCNDNCNDGSRLPEVRAKVLEYITSFQRDYEQGKDPFHWLKSGIGQRAWFQRVWTLQELSNAQLVVYRCGSEDVSFEHWWITLKFLAIFVGWFYRRCQTDHIPLSNLYPALAAAYAIPTTHSHLRRKKLVNPNQSALSLHSLLWSTCRIDARKQRILATDHRDRVYGLLGIANDAAAREIVPDYTLPCEEVYKNTARTLLRHGHLDILTMCRIRNPESGLELPSWVPDWTAPMQESWGEIMENDLFHASPRQKDTVRDLDWLTSSQVCLQGVFVDEIAEIGDPWVSGMEVQFDLYAARLLFDNVAEFFSRTQLYTEKQKEEGIWRLPCRELEESRLYREEQRASDRAYQGYSRLRRVMDGLEDASNVTGDDSAAVVSYQTVMEQLRDCRPFLGKSGHVGLCTMASQPGDQVVIFLGAHVPYVIRRATGLAQEQTVWRLIGESHVYGVMHGEFMEKEPDVEDIILQ